jgi:ABC-2 type transport system ATP-binding protein
VRIRLQDPAARPGVLALLGPDADHDGRDLSVPAPDGMASLAAVITRLTPVAAELADIGLARPTLDEVFTRLTSPDAPDDPDAPDSPGGPDATGAAAGTAPADLAGAR